MLLQPSILLAVLCICLFLLQEEASGLVTNLNPNKVKVGRVKAGPIDISSIGCGTWSWGNRLLWDYGKFVAAYRMIH